MIKFDWEQRTAEIKALEKDQLERIVLDALYKSNVITNQTSKMERTEEVKFIEDLAAEIRMHFQLCVLGEI
jgi:hypothetical protein